MKKTAILLLLALLAFGPMAWAQTTQTINLSNGDNQTVIISDTIETVSVFAYSTDMFASAVTLTAPTGCLLRLYGTITSGVLSVYWEDEYYSGSNGDFDFWVNSNQIEIGVDGNPVNLFVNVAVYNPQRIDSEEKLLIFLNHGISDLKLISDVTLSEYLTIGQNSSQTVTIDLNGYTLQRNGLTSPDANGHVIEVFGEGTLTLENGTLTGGYANNGGGICNYGTTTLNNVTITNCRAINGGGIMNYLDATLNIDNCNINNCRSTAGGGAIVNHGEADIYHCDFIDNIGTTRGGAIWNDNDLEMHYGTFSGNTAPVSGIEGDGGTIHLDGGFTKIFNVTITNSSSTNGGGIYVTSSAYLRLQESSISNCGSVAGGGAIVNKGTTYILSCSFNNNVATTRGGAIWSSNSLTVGFSDFIGNRSAIGEHDGDGGALHVDAGTAQLEYVTITGNTSKEGGGIYVASGASLTINGDMTNSNVISDNTSPLGGGISADGTISVMCCTFSNNSSQGGGGIFANAAAELTDCLFSNNQGVLRGGGIAAYNSLSLMFCNFDSNNALNGEGGALYLKESDACSATLTGCNFTGNISSSGGAIYAGQNSTLTVDGGSITGNESSNQFGGGIETYGTLNIKGNLQVKENTPDNIFLAEGNTINVTGAISSGENSIGVNMERPGVITNGYGASGTTVIPFFAYDINSVTEANGECIWVFGYYECSWDETNRTVIHTPKLLTESYRNLCDSDFTNGGNLPRGWYIVNGNTDIGTHSFECAAEAHGVAHVHIILCDNSSLTTNGLFVNNADYGDNRSLHIYCQSYGDRMGKLTSINTQNHYSAGIGASQGLNSGQVYIHGGNIHGEVNCSSHNSDTDGAGIGGEHYYDAPLVYIYDGIVYAQGGRGAAGIGGGGSSAIREVNIYGGTVTAKGGKGGSGIGNGERFVPLASKTTNINIEGGTVNATGGGALYDAFPQRSAGAGIGIGGSTAADYNEHLYVFINGGYVKAQGGTGHDGSGNWEKYAGAAGIGTGGDALHITPEKIVVDITGGEVDARGGGYYETAQHDGAGIGGGFGSCGGTVTITGGKVTAVSGLDGASAIGAGDECEVNGTLTLPNDYSVKAGVNSGSLSLSPANNRVYDCMHEFYAIIEPCVHTNGEWNAATDIIWCAICPNCNLLGPVYKPYTFQTAGSWNTASNWFKSLAPYHPDATVALLAAATIPSGSAVQVNTIDIQDGGTLTIADGGQLIHNNEGVVATVEKHILGYGTEEGCYHLIANPVSSQQIPSALGMLENEYDLYQFDQSQNLEWQNYKQNSFNFENSTGYLYANSVSTDIAFGGVLNPANANVSMPLVYDANAKFVGWNLVGNPFAATAYIADGRDFYVMNADGSDIEPAERDSIAPMEGVFVIAETDGETMTFTTEEPVNTSKRLLVNVSHANRDGVSAGSTTTVIDRAIVRFGEGRQLPKLQINRNSTKVYISQDNRNYAVVNAEDEGEMLVYFMAKENGTYTISVNIDNVEMNYLHLIDNLTGANVDLLVNTSYSFEAKTTDNASRFKLVFSAK